MYTHTYMYVYIYIYVCIVIIRPTTTTSAACPPRSWGAWALAGRRTAHIPNSHHKIQVSSDPTLDKS